MLIILLLKNWRDPSKQNINFGDDLQQLLKKANIFCFAESRYPSIGIIIFNIKTQISFLRIYLDVKLRVRRFIVRTAY